jgi:hypothetical protein
MSEALEPRILFSADLPWAALDPSGHDDLAPYIEQSIDRAEPEVAADDAGYEVRRELVFVDARLPEAAALVAAIDAQDDPQRIYDVVVLTADQDGITQIAAALAEHSGVDAVHLLSHGSADGLQLGATWLSVDTLGDHLGAIESWGGHLGESADLLIYGCDLAGSAQGLALLESLRSLTGADVAASDDTTGHPLLGGDWDLEYVGGTVEADVAAGAPLRETWQELLAAPVITSDGGGPAAGVSVIEGTTAVTTVTATDADVGDVLTYSIFGGADAARFTINASSGALRFITAPDFGTPTDANADNVYEVTVRVGDGNGGFDTQALSVSVVDYDVARYLVGAGDGSDVPVATVTSSTPTDPSLDNFDPARNADVGLELAKSSLGVNETDPTKYQLWLEPSTGVTIDGSVKLTLWTAMKKFDEKKDGSITAYLVDSNASGSSVTVIASVTIARADWDRDNSGTWIEDTFDFGYVNYTLGAGRHAGVKIVVDATSQDDMWLAYDAAAYPSAVHYTVGNDAPVLSGANNLASIAEDDVGNAGTLVASLIAGHISDADAGALRGIAVIGVDDTNGTWQFSTNGGGTWAAFGTVDSANARLLAADGATRVRFVPAADYAGTVTSGITFHAWDQTAGMAGGTASITSTYTVRDEFATISYDNNDGTANWASSWIETNDSGSPSSGDLQVTGGELRVGSNGGSVESIRRAANLAGATNATLTFDFRTSSGVDAADAVAIDVSTNGGTTWVTLETFTGITGASSGSRSYDISAYASAGTQIRARIVNNYGGTSEYFYLDNVQIAYVAPTGGSSGAFSAATASSGITVTSVNDAPTGSVTIDNMSPAQGAVLTASDTLADADGLSGPISYQWQRNGVNIAGATGTTYTTTQADVGSAISVVASYTDNQGTAESVSSGSTAAVTNVNDAPTGSVTIDNMTPAQGALLTASNTLADPDGLGSISYQWQRNGVAIAGATGSTYTTTQADVGLAISVVANYTDSQGTAESVSSGSTAAVTNVNDAPTGSVTIDNMSPAQGAVLTASNTLSDPDGLGTINYQWQRNGAAIAGATGSTYTTTQADVGSTLSVVASYTDNQGTAESVSSAATAAVSNVNDPPTGSVTIDNLTPAEGDVLTASNTLADADGLAGPISYQWQRNGVAIAGATASTYTTTQGDVGSAISVVASYTDNQGTAESVTSAATAAVTNVNDPPTGTVTIDNTTPAQGDVLTASNTLADADGLSGPISYQWQRNGVAIAGATASTYTTTQADVGSAISVVANYTDNQGTAESVSSASTAPVTNVNDPPMGSVTIDNLTPAEGDVLTASNTLADVDGVSGPLTYQWQRAGVDIVGATGSTYTTTQADVGAAISVVASYTDNQGTAESVSSAATAAVTNVNDPPTGSVTIDNMTPAEGDLLTASNTLADADGLSGPISYQWQRNGVAIAGATASTYTATQADVGSAISVVASYTDDQGTAESVSSAPTAVVTNVNNAPTGNVTIDNTSPAQSDVLAASNTLADVDGLSGPISYQWQRNGVAIAGATASTYTTTQADVGSAISVVASYTDNLGTSESVSSAATAAVTNVNDPPTGSVTIDNMTPAEGDLLTASNTLADADGLSGPISYQWQRNGVAIAGATASTYTTMQADVGSAISVIASYTDNQGTAESVSSAPTAVVTNVNNAPTGSVTIDNTSPAQGDVLMASNTLADVDGLSGPIIYQWQRNGAAIAGATASTYTTTQADVGSAISVVASYTDNQGTAESVSSASTAPVTNVNDPPTGSVTIDNMTPAEGDLLTASNTLADADGLSGPISYQWQRNGVAIAGATASTYTTMQADVGSAISVIASYTDNQGTAESVSSAATAAVTNVNDPPTGSVTIDNLTPAEGDLLTASNTLADADGLSGPIGYQWQRNGVAIAGANASTYTATQADVGSAISVVASYTDNQGTSESVSSASTAPVTNVNNVPTGSVTIDNTTPAQGDVLTASNTLADADGLSGPISYQWQRNGVAIAGATASTYTATQADVGAALSVAASYTDDRGTAESVSSAPTTAVTNVNDSPTGGVTISDTAPSQGDPLTASHTVADADGLSGAINYQWRRDGVDIAGATGSVYITTQADVGARLTVLLSYIDDAGAVEAVSSAATVAVTNVNDAPTGAVTIDNMAPVQGDVLSARNVLSDADGLSGPISYQWRRNGIDIAGATSSTYTTTQADVGSPLTVVASYIDDGGTSESSSSGRTNPVASPSSPPTGTPEPLPDSTLADPTSADPPRATAGGGSVAGPSSATGEVTDVGDMRAFGPELALQPAVEVLPYPGSSHPHQVVVTSDVIEAAYLAEASPAKPPLLQRIAVTFGTGQRGAIQFVLNEVQPPSSALSPALAAALDELAESSKPRPLDLHMTGAVAASVSLSAGVVAWMLRSGALLAGLIASKPAWAQFDPLPIFDRRTPDDPMNPEEQRRGDRNEAEVERP